MSLPRWDRTRLDEEVASREIVIVDLRADWCPQCGPQERVIERVIAEHPEIGAGTIDIEEEPSVVDEFDVSGLPTVLVFREGELAEALRGFTRATSIQRVL